MDSVHSGPPRSFGSVPPGRYSERFPESSRFNSPSGDTALPQVPGRRFIRPAAVRPGNIRAPAPFPAPGGGIFPHLRPRNLQPRNLRPPSGGVSPCNFRLPAPHPAPGDNIFRNLRPRHPSRPLGRRQPRSAAMNSGQRVQRFSVRSHSSRACAPTEGCSLSMSRR